MLVDDHKLFRRGMQMLVDSLDHFEVTGEAANGIEFLDLLDHSKPDIVMLDISMPEMDGIEAAKIALTKHPDLKIITISMYGDQVHYFKMVDIGVKGFLLKNSDLTEVKMALETVIGGDTYFSRELLMNLVTSLKHADEPSPNSRVSNRESEVLLLICQGLSTHQIAESLSLSKRTVDNHRANILVKTGCRNTASLVAYAIKEKLVEF